MRIAYKIEADGTDVTAKFQDRLISMTINDEAGQKSDSAEIVIDDRDNLVALPDVGAKLRLSLGFEGDLVEIGSFVVDDLAGEIDPDLLTISAKAADMLGGLRARRTRAWEDVTLGDIVETIAGEHGLKPQVSESLKARFYPYIAQTTESDLNLLTRLAGALDAVAKPVGGSLVVVKSGESKAADGTTLPVFGVHRTQISGGSWQLNGRGRYGKVICEWTDRVTAEVKCEEAGDAEPVLRLRHRQATQADAQHAARSALSRSKRASGKIRIDLGGFWGELTAEAKVNLTGIKPELCGEWLITRVTHRLHGTLTTSFEAERDNEEAQKS